MGALESGLKRLAEFQMRHTVPIVIAVVIFTALMAAGATMVQIETDFTKELPQDLDIIVLNNRIDEKFSGQDTSLVVVTLDEDSNFRGSVTDIRDPSVIAYLAQLDGALSQDPSIESVFSLGTFLGSFPLSSVSDTKAALDAVPQAKQLISDDYKTTVVVVTSDVGSSEDRVRALTEVMQENVDAIPAPPGVKAIVTGTPQINNIVFELLGNDAVTTILAAAAVIFLLLFALQRSLTRGIVVFVPLGLGIIWTWGTLGWTGTKLSIATAAIGAMILGLGVEYGAFMLTRFREERAKGSSQLDSLKVAVPAIGGAVIGSGTTTMVGFLALTLSVLPLLQRLGISLAMGIFYSLAAAVLVQPVMIVLQERAAHWYDRVRHRRARDALKKYEGVSM